MHVLSRLYKLREQLTPYSGGLKGYLRAPRSQMVYFVDIQEYPTYKYNTKPEIWWELKVDGRTFEEYVKMFLARFSDYA